MTIEAQKPQQNVLVIGATGGTGRAVVNQLLQDGHKVTAFSRHATQAFQQNSQLTPIDGDVMQSRDLERAVPNHDVVIVVLGINENPLFVRLFGASKTPVNVRSKGTENVIAAMHKHGVTRLIVQSSYGVGETRHLLKMMDRLFFSLLLKPQIDDTEKQEQIVRASGLQWVLAQPVHLVDRVDNDVPYLSTRGQTRGMKVARKAVARFLAIAVKEPDFVGKTVAVSG